MYEISYGTNYEATKGLNKVEITKLIRKDIKAAFPGVKFTCRGGHSISVNIVSAPFAIVSREWVAFSKENPHVYNADLPRYTPETNKMIKDIQSIIGSYNYDGSDIQSDYFNVRFYSNVGVAYETEKAEKEAIVSSLVAVAS